MASFSEPAAPSPDEWLVVETPTNPLGRVIMVTLIRLLEETCLKMQDIGAL